MTIYYDSTGLLSLLYRWLVGWFFRKVTINYIFLNLSHMVKKKIQEISKTYIDNIILCYCRLLIFILILKHALNIFLYYVASPMYDVPTVYGSVTFVLLPECFPLSIVLFAGEEVNHFFFIMIIIIMRRWCDILIFKSGGTKDEQPRQNVLHSSDVYTSGSSCRSTRCRDFNFENNNWNDIKTSQLAVKSKIRVHVGALQHRSPRTCIRIYVCATTNTGILYTFPMYIMYNIHKYTKHEAPGGALNKY